MRTLRSMKDKRGFTLVELLVVIVIIAVLSALLLTAISSARRFARRVTAQTEVKNLELAWKKYYQEYHKWPQNTALGGITDPERNAVAIAGDVADMLRGQDIADGNPKLFQFLIFEESRVDESGNPVNPWRIPGDTDNPVEEFYYYVKLDANYDNEIDGTGDEDEPPFATLQRPVIAWTVDPDGAVIGSWEL